jgi:peptidoglycan hydrolase-like protein with peptidoglycan-binding domain/GH25 family lysozyme M1 (1,4-beta-N-acetylmuramidase)
MTDAQGEDRSNYQPAGEPWRQDFGGCKATESTSYLDLAFAANWKALAAAGIPRIAYHFFHPAVSAVAQARYFVAAVKAQGLKAGDILAIDCELTVAASAAEVLGTRQAVIPRMHVGPQALTVAGPGCTHDALPVPVYGATSWCQTCRQYCGGTSEQGVPVSCQACALALSAAAASFSLQDVAMAFLDEVASLAGPHCPLLFYTYSDMAESFSSALSEKYPDLWIAAYDIASPVIGPWKAWRFWQTKSGGGPGGGDADVYNGSKSQLDDWVATYKPPSSAPVIPAWQAAIIKRLPELASGARDQGGKTEWVKQAQLLLDITWQPSLAADGDFGPATKAAVEALQADDHVRADGIIGPQTWQALIAGTPAGVLPSRLASGAKDPVGGIDFVRRVQALCDVHGEPTAVDGVFGPATEASVKAVQRAYGEPETGVVDEACWSLLIAHAKP